MISLSIRNGLFGFTFKGFHNFFRFRTIVLIAVAALLASCGGETVRTEAEYIDIATEAHAKGNSRLAIIELAAGIRHFPRNPDLQILRGKIFLDLEDGSAAEIAFNKAVSLGYNSSFIKHEMAESWLYQRNPGKIIEKLEPEILQGSKDALIYEIVGRAYIASRDRSNVALFMKNMNKAEEYINEAFRISPNNTRVLITKAWLTALAGNIDEALEWLDKADSIISDQRENLAVRGELLIRQDKIDQAQETYDRLVKKFPQYPQYKLELGFTYLLNRNYAKSREWVEPVAKQYPNQIRPKYLLANISLMEKKYEVAKQLSDAVLVVTPDDLKTVIINGASSYFLGDYENAHQKLNFYYDRTGSLSALKLLVATKLKLGDDQTAEKLLQDAGQTAEDQTDAELLNLVAIASAKVGKVDVALSAYKQLSEQQPDTTSYQSNMGLIQISQGNYEEGFANLEKSLKDNANETETGQNLYILTTKALQTQQYDRAAGYIEQYKKTASDSYKPWVMSAVLQNILKNNDAARQDFDKAMEVAPDVAEVRARYAIFEKFQGNQDKAMDLAGQALKLDPGNIGAGKLVLGEYIRQREFNKVRITIDNAIGYDKITEAGKLIFADYYTMLGRPQDTLNILAPLPDALKATASYKIISGKAYLRNGQPENAVEMLEAFSQDNPNNIQALKLLLQGYLLTNAQRKYQSTLEKIDRLSPDDYDNQIELAKLYISTRKYDQADKTLKAITTESEQQSFEKEIIRASLENNRKNYNKALAILGPLNKKYPANGTVSMLYSRTLVNDGQIEEAIKVSNSWAEKHPENNDVKLFLGDLYTRAGDDENARKHYQALLSSTKKITPRAEIHANNNLAIIYLKSDQVDMAAKHAQKAFDMAPNNPPVVDTYAQMLMKQGQAEKAIAHFNQALALLPTNDRRNRSLFSFGKAKALIQSDQKAQAQKILKRLIKNDPDFPQIEQAKEMLAGL